MYILLVLYFVLSFVPLLVRVSPRLHSLHLNKVSLLLLVAKLRTLGSPVLNLTPSRNATLLGKRYIAERRSELDYNIEDVKGLCISVVLKFTSAYIVCKPLHMFVPIANSLEIFIFFFGY